VLALLHSATHGALTAMTFGLVTLLLVVVIRRLSLRRWAAATVSAAVFVARSGGSYCSFQPARPLVRCFASQGSNWRTQSPRTCACSRMQVGWAPGSETIRRWLRSTATAQVCRVRSRSIQWIDDPGMGLRPGAAHCNLAASAADCASSRSVVARQGFVFCSDRGGLPWSRLHARPIAMRASTKSR
jgi:hypothetical protein